MNTWYYWLSFQPEGRGFDSRSSRHVGTLGKSFTYSCLCASRETPFNSYLIISCSGLPPRSLPSHPGHQRVQFTPIIRTGVTLCSFCSYIHNPGPCILCGWSLCMEWASVVAKIAPQDSF